MIRFTKPTLQDHSVDDIWVQSEDIGAIFYKGWKFELFRHWSAHNANCWLILYQKASPEGHEGIQHDQPVELVFHYSDAEEPIEICKEFYQYMSYEISA